MGNCRPCNATSQSDKVNAVCRTIDTQQVAGQLAKLGDVNLAFFTDERLSHSPMSYALFKGKLRSFQYMVQSMGGSLQLLEELLESQGT